MDPFEQSADMRLLELQRKALGISAPERPNWTGSHNEVADGIPIAQDDLPVLTGPRITVDLSANPDEKLIPGAVVTLSLSVHNTGDESAEDVRIAVPLPGEAAYRDGSLSVDGRRTSASEADAFLGSGYVIPLLEAGQRLGFVWKVSVEAGLAPLLVAPRVTAKKSGVSGGKPVRLTRGAAVAAALPAAPKAAEPAELPFYELDDDEVQQVAREVRTGENERQIPDTPLVVMPDIIVEEPPAVEEQVPAPAAAQTPRLYCGFDAPALAIVKKLFSAESFGQIPHYILQNSLASSHTTAGSDFGIPAHLAHQSGMLSRALLMHRLRKPMKVEDFSAGRTSFELTLESGRGASPAPSPLYTELTQAEVDFCAPVGERNPLETFIRVRQLAVSLQARRVDTNDAALKERIEDLLEKYSAGARAAINRTFIKAKLDKNYDPFGSADTAADKVAHDLIDALALLFAP